MNTSKENNSRLMGPKNLQGGARVGFGKVVTAEVGRNRRALSTINLNVIGNQSCVVVNKRGLQEKSNGVNDRNLTNVPVHRPITRWFAAQLANKKEVKQPSPLKIFTSEKRRWGLFGVDIGVLDLIEMGSRIGHSLLVPRTCSVETLGLPPEIQPIRHLVALPLRAPPSSLASFLQMNPLRYSGPPGFLSFTSLSANVYSPVPIPSLPLGLMRTRPVFGEPPKLGVLMGSLHAMMGPHQGSRFHNTGSRDTTFRRQFPSGESDFGGCITCKLAQWEAKKPKLSILSKDCTIIDVDEYKAANDLPLPMFTKLTEVEIEEVEMEDVSPDPIIDIDSCDSNNPLAVVEYIKDIYSYYRKTECVEGKPLFDFDRTRIFRSGLVGFSLHGSLSHYYYQFCEDWWVVPIKVAFDQTARAKTLEHHLLCGYGVVAFESPTQRSQVN
ncbi:hypothetical protein IFM89_037158 [Coptis chinensis]|uniref:Uncharacterized protein n=1 Tax=Coptis chinensis TaxID=261450 RepID=A0A835I9T1_9MAGN|nr:hypothetical protein IFM89_037158 [Coptis chinensis]